MSPTLEECFELPGEPVAQEISNNSCPPEELVIPESPIPQNGLAQESPVTLHILPHYQEERWVQIGPCDFVHICHITFVWEGQPYWYTNTSVYKEGVLTEQTCSEMLEGIPPHQQLGKETDAGPAKIPVSKARRKQSKRGKGHKD